MMTETQFLMALNKTTTAYTWTVEGKKIVGTAKRSLILLLPFGVHRDSVMEPLLKLQRSWV